MMHLLVKHIHNEVILWTIDTNFDTMTFAHNYSQYTEKIIFHEASIDSTSIFNDNVHPISFTFS